MVLDEHHTIQDSDSSGSYTVKCYKREKSHDPEGRWSLTTIHVEPLNPEVRPIFLRNIVEGEVRVVAEMLEMLGAEANPV